jgi:putative transposase
MRRFKVLEGEAVYHCMSRTVDGRFLFDMQAGASPEADHFVGLMRRLEAFCGVQILTYALMSNHFHILVRVPGGKPDLSDAELVERVRGLNGNGAADELEWFLAHLREQDKSGQAAEKEKGRYLARMHDVSEFLRELKGRFAQWYNRRHERYGVLWADRFKSVLVEGGTGARSPEPLETMAAYIDLNPVRAGLCEDPKDYRYCGYGEAVSGSEVKRKRARAGLAWVVARGGTDPNVSKVPSSAMEWRIEWRMVGRLYRGHLFGTILEEIEEKGVTRGLSSAEVARKVLKEGGALSRAQVLRCRVRYFSDGLVLGSKEFVESLFEQERARFSQKRKSGPRRMKGADWGGLFVFRDLRKRPVG